MVRQLWGGRYGAAIMVRPLWCGVSMVLVFYGARQYGAMVRRIFLLFGIFGGPYNGRFLNSVFIMLQITISIQNQCWKLSCITSINFGKSITSAVHSVTHLTIKDEALSLITSNFFFKSLIKIRFLRSVGSGR